MKPMDAKGQQGEVFKEVLALHLSELFDKLSLTFDRAVDALNLPHREQHVASDTGGSEQIGVRSSSSASSGPRPMYSNAEPQQGHLFQQLKKKAGGQWVTKEDMPNVLDNFSEPEDENVTPTTQTSTAWTPKAPPSMEPVPPHSQPPNVNMQSPSRTPDLSYRNERSSKKVCWHSDTFEDVPALVDNNSFRPVTSFETDDQDRSSVLGETMYACDEDDHTFRKKASIESTSSLSVRIPNNTGGMHNDAHSVPQSARSSLNVLEVPVIGGSPRHGGRLNLRDDHSKGDKVTEEVGHIDSRVSILSGRSDVGMSTERQPIRGSLGVGCLKKEVIRCSNNSTKSMSHKFDILRHWRTDDELFRRRRTPPVKMGTGALLGYNDFEDGGNDPEWDMLETVMYSDSVMSRHMMFHPNSRRRITWEFLALFFVSYDIVTIPLEFFDPPRIAAIEAMGWLVRIFWTLDIIVNFLTGYVNQAGDVEMRIHNIAKKYFRTWFILDFVIVLFNWMEVSVDHIGTAPRSLRFLKIARLLRLVKATTLSRVIGENFMSEKMRLAFGILKILILVLVVAHFIACLWYGVGNISAVGIENWVSHYNLEDAPLKAKYLSSFHWSLTQFTGPDMDLQPLNDTERTFTIIVLVSCYVVSACFVSSITTSMTRLELLAEHQTHLFVALRRYLDENRISNKLSSRVQRNAHHAISERLCNVQESEVELLNLVSEPLRIELHFEIYEPIVKAHPLFARYMEVSPAGIRKLCHTSIDVINLSCGDVLFSDFEFPEIPRMYFLLPHGRTQYIRDGLRTQYMVDKEWCCEATLWTTWMHVGMMRAMTNVRLLTIHRDLVATAMSQFRTRDFRPEGYAKGFVESLNRGTAHLTDLRDPEMDWEGMLLEAFPKDEGPSRRGTGRKSFIHDLRGNKGSQGKGNNMHFVVPTKSMHKLAEAWHDKTGR